jgi:hypothetical protein
MRLFSLTQDFWRTVARQLELCARAFVEAKTERTEDEGLADRARVAFADALAAAAEAQGLPADREARLQGLIYFTAMAGLSGLCPAVAAYCGGANGEA